MLLFPLFHIFTNFTFHSRLAQRTRERRISNPQVAGSNPASAISTFGFWIADYQRSETYVHKQKSKISNPLLATKINVAV